MKKIFFLFSASVFLYACTPKPLPIDEFEESIFFVRGSINATVLNISAGDSNYFMSTSSAIDAQGVTGFTGTLENLINANLKKISIEFKNQDASKALDKTNYFTPAPFNNYLPDGNKNYRTVIVSMQENGVTYKSYKSSNNSSKNIFTFTEKSDYQLNAANKPTINVKGSVNTYLYNTANDNDSLLLNLPSVSIAIPVE